jgi:hypothetical protein
MPLPPDVQAAKDRMEKAQAALLADIESRTTDREGRVELLDRFQIATDRYMEMIDRLR